MLHQPDLDYYDFCPLGEYEAEPVRWLWKPYLPAGAVALLDGDPGVGKTFVAVDLAARLTRGGEWPCGQPVPKGVDGTPLGAAFAANSSDVHELRLRAQAAGADAARLLLATCPRTIKASNRVFPRDPFLLAKRFRDKRLGLIAFDPLPLLLPPRVLGSHAPSAWEALDPFVSAAAQSGTVPLLVRHRTKTGRQPALVRGLGGVSLAAAARAALLVARHPDDPDLRLLIPTKSNFDAPAPTLGFRIVNGVVEWEGPVDIAADELGIEPEAERVKRPRERAVEWLQEELAQGPRRAAELQSAAKRRGIPDRTLDRAKKALDIQSEMRWKGDLREWYWVDPAVRNEARLTEPEVGSFALVPAEVFVAEVKNE
jgi:hypothetical protein